MPKLADIISIIKFGLENLDQFSEGSKKIRVKDLSVINVDTFCCSFYPESISAIDIKVEISGIMAFLNGFFRESLSDEIKFNYYAVRAFDNNNEELMYAISSKAASELISKGNSIDWLKSTLFQENTSDYRLAQSKKIISEIENCLRAIVKKKLNEQFGTDWWDKSLNNKLGDSVKETYSNQFGVVCTDGDVLISYTYTLQLKKIISTHFKLFKSYFEDLANFDIDMDELNKIRREEAHNRNITQENLNALHQLHEKLTAKILLDLENFQSAYLTENWKIKIKKVMFENPYKSIHDEGEVLKERNSVVKLQKTKENIENLITYLENTTANLRSISAPIHKKSVQRELVNIFDTQKDLQINLLEQTTELNEDKAKAIVTKIEEHGKTMNSFVSSFLLNES